LVLPNELAGSEEILEFVAKEISENSYVNIMSQYRPEGDAYTYPELNRPVTRAEFMKVVSIARELGLTRGLEQKQLRRFWLWSF